MILSKKLLTLLAIFCVIASAGAVCAADGYSDSGYDGISYASDDNGWAGSQYNQDEQGGWAGSQYNQDEQGGWAGSQYNETLEHAAGEPVTASASQNMTVSAASSHMLPTGNPILALLAVSVILGGYAVLRRK